ncbi:ATP-binding cassette domain-containing protein, partial [Brevundimonas sp.]
MVGRNGAGKSTLLRLIAGETAPAEGAVTQMGAVGVLHQRHDPASGERVAETLGVGHAMAVIDRVLAGEAEDDDLERADWTLESRIAPMLASVGLSGLDLDRPTQTLSGGELTRLRLAGLMLAGPDLLLL